MGKWLKKLEQWLGGGQGGTKRVHTFRWLIIVGLIGVAIVLFNSFVNVKKLDNENIGREPPAGAESQETFQSSAGQTSDFAAIEETAEGRMKDILEKIVGVGTVDVMVTVDSTEEIVYQRNVKDSQQQSEENDANGGQRHTTQYTRDGEIVTYEQSGTQTPIITKKVKPQIRGVLIVAKGAENEVVRNLIVDAVEKGLNVPDYRISVVPRKQG
ncbi:stage III sporulation protein AG [Paenibacillus cellulositrophicus]|jgi:stage III sporulation protein AG|uniref:Stage III sporulation protein AG n=3 Tax=Paenibacillus TaxID=44249 RepID=A0A1R1EUU4_9BACL|nr:MULTISPECIES: stage III sporulation protein AG [Paenibacillus]MCM2999441.1 stage III sporulation protein AG [Paenibacillus cellulositrophicus]OMF55620.1 stage III sporulation protein AG [Paenibacillus rhizosphaerae]OXL84742.1 stage III sporulation protein AG [Paenibacillus sp. SSG-1]RED39363.1 stage III sporulation protein AG [Paenibacillus sp. VMFN-D1]UYO01696.1 stage III sporulation protein AG [Paenibacillus sp. PSB04]